MCNTIREAEVRLEIPNSYILQGMKMLELITNNETCPSFYKTYNTYLTNNMSYCINKLI